LTELGIATQCKSPKTHLPSHSECVEILTWYKSLGVKLRSTDKTYHPLNRKLLVKIVITPLNSASEPLQQPFHFI